EVKPAPPKPRPAPPPPPPPPPVEPSPEVVEAPRPLTDGSDALPTGPVQVESTGEQMADLATEPPPCSPEGAASVASDPAAGAGALPTPLPPPQVPDDSPVAEQALPPAQVPPSMRLMYEVSGRVKGINYNASGSLDWENLGDRY